MWIAGPEVQPRSGSCTSRSRPRASAAVARRPGVPSTERPIRDPNDAGPPFGRLALVLWLVGIAVLTLVPVSVPPGTEIEGGACLVCGDRGAADAILNVFLFVPVGYGLAGRLGAVAAAAVGMAISGGIEVAQLWVPGRYSTLGDVVFNGLGAAAGAVLRGRLRAAVPWFGGLALAGLVAPLVLLVPRPPVSTYYGQWTADLIYLEAYEGELLQARVGDLEVPGWRYRDSEALRRRLLERAPVEVRFVVGPPPPGLAPVFSIYDHVRKEVLLLGVDGQDLVVRQWRLASDLRLDRPELRMPGAMAGLAPGDTVVAGVEFGGFSPCMSLEGRTQCDVAPGMGSGWALLVYPPPLGPRWIGVFDLVWLLVSGSFVGALLQRWGPPWLLAAALTGTLGLAAWRLPWLDPSVAEGIVLLGSVAVVGTVVRRRFGAGGAVR